MGGKGVCVCVYLCDALVREDNRSGLIIEDLSSFGTFLH